MDERTAVQVGSSGQAPERRPGIGLRILMGLFTIGMGAVGVLGLYVAMEIRSSAAELEDEGIETQADVVQVTATTSNDRLLHHTIDLAFDGADGRTFADVLDCDGARWEDGMDTVDVVYAPSDPDNVRLVACPASSFSQALPGVGGALLLGLSLFIVWRAFRNWRRRARL